MENFILRQWTMEDAARLAVICNNENIARWLRDIFPHPYTLEDAERYLTICTTCSEQRQLMRAITVDEKVVGAISVEVQRDIYRKSAELGYWLAENFWGRGIVTAAVKQMCAMAFEKLDIVRIFATTLENNFASRRVLEKAGFTCEGILRNSAFKNGEILSCSMYALLKDSTS